MELTESQYWRLESPSVDQVYLHFDPNSTNITEGFEKLLSEKAAEAERSACIPRFLLQKLSGVALRGASQGIRQGASVASLPCRFIDGILKGL